MPRTPSCVPDDTVPDEDPMKDIRLLAVLMCPLGVQAQREKAGVVTGCCTHAGCVFEVLLTARYAVPALSLIHI